MESPAPCIEETKKSSIQKNSVLSMQESKTPEAIPLSTSAKDFLYEEDSKKQEANRLQSYSEGIDLPTDNIAEDIRSRSSSSDSNQAVPLDEGIAEASQQHLGEQSIRKKVNILPPVHWENKPLPSPNSSKKIRIFSMTWNMFGKPPPEDISILFPKYSKHHVYIIVTQECLRSIGTSLFYSSKKTWEVKLQECLGQDYNLYAANTLGATHIAIFIHFSMKNIISTPCLQKVSTGFGNVVRNKGAVGVKFVVGSTSVLVVGCHLASGQNNVVNRNNDFRRIEKELFKDVSSQPASELCDVCIYLGDLNYRINGIRRDVENLLDLEILDPLRKGDQLLKELLQNTLFAGFQEGPLVFDPTYRYDIGTNVFDTSKKQRVPGWTDRVLYKSKGFKMVQKSYNSLPSSLTSDHRPVFAQFKLKYEDYVQSTNKSTNSRTCQVF
jgi:hypothetical protein